MNKLPLQDLKIDKFAHLCEDVSVNRRTYQVQITVNGHKIKTVVIDPHYEIKHSATITDGLILQLVAQLDGGDFSPESVAKNFEYHMTDNLVARGKKYRLVWLIEREQLFVGVINAYRRK
ncbi:MAG: hypothetical protein IPK04_10315 [Bdellovibrionales bacterium]|nr:hypothetical protein [Bdellovibrionales bacterium]